MFTSIMIWWNCGPLIWFCMELSFKNKKVSFFLNLEFLYKITLGKMLLFLLGGLFICLWFCGWVFCLFCFLFYFWSSNHKDTLSKVINSVMDKKTVEPDWLSWNLPIECRGLPTNTTALECQFWNSMMHAYIILINLSNVLHCIPTSCASWICNWL